MFYAGYRAPSDTVAPARSFSRIRDLVRSLAAIPSDAGRQPKGFRVSDDERIPAAEPDDLGRFFVERANAGDVEGLVALYEPDAVLVFPPGNVTTGSAAIRQVFTEFVASGVKLTPGDPRPTLRVGGLALTSTRLPNGDVTAEVARRQPDGTWRWVIDQPNVLGE